MCVCVSVCARGEISCIPNMEFRKAERLVENRVNGNRS